MILALQAAGPVTSMWLIKSSSELATEPTLVWESGRQLATELLGKITTILRQHDAELGDLTGIIIFSGPGSFTSLRIGHTVVNTLADALNVPVAGAMGDDWLSDGLHQLATPKPGSIALPVYGAEANITKQKR
jgi:tRNA threonylcarbamoyladenosine biosynthesis protein TsaB